MLAKIPNNLITDLFAGDITTVSAKKDALLVLINKIENKEETTENESTAFHWLSITSAFVTAGTITGLSAVNPIMGAIYATGAIAGAITTIGNTFKKNFKDNRTIDELKRYRIALKSANIVDWAALWSYCGDKLFLEAINEASCGNINDGRLYRSTDDKNPLAAAIDFLSSYSGISRDEIVVKLRAIKAGQIIELPSLDTPNANNLPATQRTVLQDNPRLNPADSNANNPIDTTPNNYVDNTTAIINSLVANADKSKLNGCIIVAAPGAGKTTFLGTAWGRLKQQYGSKFKSMAVIIKKTDVKAFSGVADKVICADGAARLAAVEILKFINDSMDNHGEVRRLFLDDFLALNKEFAAALTGLFINLSTYEVVTTRKDDPDAQPLLATLYAKLTSLWTVGREYNSCLWVSSHNSNVDALPFVGGRESRGIGALIYLVLDNNREFITQTLDNNNLLGDNIQRNKLKEQFANIKVSPNEPIVLANFNNWTLGIVPETVLIEYQEYRNLWETNAPTRITDTAVATPDSRLLAERLWKLDAVENPLNVIDSALEETEIDIDSLNISETAKRVLIILNASPNDTTSIESIRKSKYWERDFKTKTPFKGEIKKALTELLEKTLIWSNESEGYSSK